MSPVPIERNANSLDLTGRIAYSNAVVGSPADATETIIASLKLPGDIAILSGVLLVCWCAFTVGTSGVSARVRIKQTNASGATKGDTGATTAVAAQLGTRTALGIDAAPAGDQVYVATLTVGSAAAASAVSAVVFAALAI